MARQQRNARLQTWSAREALPRAHEPYWHEVRHGLHLGYRKGTRGGAWWLREFREGKLKKRRIGIADDGLRADGVTVLSFEDALRAALADERPTVTVPGRYTVEQAIEDYFTHRKAKSRSALSVVIDRSKLHAHVAERMRSRDVNSLTAEDLLRWRDALVPESEDREVLRRAQATANRVRSVFFAVLELAYRGGRVTKNDAWRRVGPFENVDHARTRALTAAEARRLLNALPAPFRRLAHAALYTGLRLGELLELRAADVDDGKVWARHTKSGRARSVPLNAEGSQFFEQLTAGKTGDALLFTRADGKPWGRMEVSRHMQRGCTAAKIAPTVTFHDLRRSYATLLLNAGADAEVIQELLGHADLRMTRRTYAHLLQGTIAKQVQSKLPSFGIAPSNVRKLNR